MRRLPEEPENDSMFHRALTLAFVYVLVNMAATLPVNNEAGIRLGSTAGVTSHTMLGTTGPETSTLESIVGAPLPLVRVYRSIGDAAIGPMEQKLLASGHELLLSIAPRTGDGTPVLLTSIAAGAEDQFFGPQFDALNAVPTTPYFIFDHEPTNQTQNKSCSRLKDCGPEFVAAWVHLHDLAARRGDTRLVWVWTMEGFTYRANYSTVVSYFPGPGYVDALGVDVYPSTCDAAGGSETFASLVAPVLEWRQAFDPSAPIVVPEWGAPSSDDALRASYIDAAAATLKSPLYKAVVGLSYFDEASAESRCSWALDPTSASFEAFANMTNDPFFNSAATAGPSLTHAEMVPEVAADGRR